MDSQSLKEKVIGLLENMKANEITSMDVAEITSVTDFMIVASGTSSRHVKSIADYVSEEMKKEGINPIGTEGERGAEWVLIDFGDVVVHVMMPTAREHYDLERLWSGLTPAQEQSESID
jgi:ribosome-associated protein